MTLDTPLPPSTRAADYALPEQHDWAAIARLIASLVTSAQ